MAIADVNFIELSGLTTLTINAGSAALTIGGFYGCSNLANVTINTGTGSISVGSFQACTSLANVDIYGTGTITITNLTFNGLSTNYLVIVPYAQFFIKGLK